MSKYCYGKISNSKEWYVRLKSWHQAVDKNGDLLPACRILKKFRGPEECRKYIDYLKEREKQNS